MNRVRGFSMVELMVAITLALVVTTGVVSVFVGSRSAYQATSGTAELTDGGRFALNFISNSVRSAGYLACSTSAHVVSTLNAGATPLPYSFNQALGGYEANNTGVGAAYAVTVPPVVGAVGNWNAAATTPNLDGALAGLPVKNNDVLVVRSTLANAQTSYVALIPAADQIQVNAPASLKSGQLAVISDCGFSVMVFQITGLAGTVISHDPAGSPGNSVASFAPLSFSAGAQVTPVNTVVYYIGAGADGDGALFSYDLNAGLNAGGAFAANELVPDIEAMQILYGIDTTNTQTVSQYVTADQVADFNTVMSVKVAVLAASAPGSAHTGPVALTYNLLGTTVTAPVDTRARQVFEETIAVRNALP
ncbi:MAG: PilW family protein [Steroidobacteraceae bacterium]